MLTGFNTDVEHRGEVFHVQTQDKGTDDAVVETLVYLGGRVLVSVSTPYSDLGDDLLERMRSQHLSLINKVLSGRFGEATGRDLSELVVDFLEKEIDEAEQPVPEDPGPDAETRKRRLQNILERLEAQIEREAAQQGAPLARPRRAAPWVHAAGVALLLAAVMIFAPMMGRLPEPVEPEMIAAGPAMLEPAPAPTPIEVSMPPAPVPVEPAPAEIAELPVPEQRVEPETNWSGKLVPYSKLDSPPQPTRREMPVYTRRASRQGHRGLVRLDLLIDEKGYVTQMKVLEKVAGSDLHEAALDAASGWRFTPPRKQGHDVKVWKTVDLEFSIWPDETEVVKIRE